MASQRQTIASSGSAAACACGHGKAATRPRGSGPSAPASRAARRLVGMPSRSRRMAEIGERRERGEPAGGFGAVGAEDARAVAGEVDARHAAAAVGIDARQPLPALRLEHELAAREVGELRLGAQVPAERRPHRLRSAARAACIAHANRGCTPSASSPSMASGCTPCSSVTPARRSARISSSAAPCEPRPREQAAQCRPRLGRRRGVEHRGDLRAGLQVLRRDEVQQRPAAEEHDARADRAGLRLQRDLRGAEAVAAGALPAGHRHQPVGGAGADDQRIEGQRLPCSRRARHASAPAVTFQASVSGR